jgi:hypothetical protein
MKIVIGSDIKSSYFTLMADQLFGLSPTMNASQNKKVVQVSMNCAMPYDNSMLSGPASQALIGLEE